MVTGLSLPQLCGQLVLGGYPSEQPPASFLAAMRQGQRAGAILFRRNVPSLEAAFANCIALRQAAPPQLPPFVSIDQEGGRVRRLPPPALQLPAMRELGARKDKGLVERVAKAVGKELATLGFNLNFAPVLDVDSNPQNPVIGDRAFSSDASEVAELGKAYIRGLESQGVMACGKHFPGHGDTNLDSHLALPSVETTQEQMQNRELIPFEAAIQEGVSAMMTAHIVCKTIDPSVPATLSEKIVTGILREKLGFKGMIVSDDMEMNAIAGAYTSGKAAVMAVRAGCDLIAICKDEARQEEAIEQLIREAEKDSAFRARCEQAVSRTLALRRQKGIAMAKSYAEALQVVQSEEALGVMREIGGG